MSVKAVPLSYILRNLWFRRVTTILTAGGMALVVFVFATVLMMSEGIRQTLVATGQPDNVMVLRKGATTEIGSAVSRDQASIIESFSGMATDQDGHRLISRETVVLNSLPKRDSPDPSNVAVRGTSAIGMAMRPQVHIVQGRFFVSGTSEVVVGQSISHGFAHAGLGDTLHFAGRDWHVVGIFDAGHSGFDSEIWADVEQVQQAYHRPTYSSVVLKLADVRAVVRIQDELKDDPRLSLDAKLEQQFYAEQSESLSTFIRLLGLSLSAIFSVGAIIGAMITMFAAVASRTAEIGTLRALGFRRGAVLAAFLGESLGFAVAGGLIGLAAASAMQSINISTVNLQTFSEMSFRFLMTPTIAIQTMVFALFMGVVGGFIPAWRAAQLSIIDCLREA